MLTLQVLSLIAAAPFAIAKPLFASHENMTLPSIRGRAPDFEWTAWGDSYASGVGAGTYINGRRCLRYQDAYPPTLQSDPDNKIQGSGSGKFNNVVCSGAKAEEVEQYQFYTSDQSSGQPNWQYKPRPSSGKPTMGTLTVGGDDIDFPGILNNCIVQGFPWPLSQGFTDRSCDEQRDLTWSLIGQNGDHNTPNSDLVGKIDSVIKKILQYGQAASGDQFKLYVTGYGQFFNADTTACNTATFARKPNGNDDVLMTTELRADFNAMSLLLNKSIQQAIGNNGDNVIYIDIDSMLTGHRFCEEGITEPDQNNANLWFYHYPYTQNTDDDTDAGIQYLNQVATENTGTLNSNWDPHSTLWVDYLNNFWDMVDEDQLMSAIGATAEDDAQVVNFWSGTIGSRAKIFHPQVNYHRAIYNAIADQYNSNAGAQSTSSATASATSTSTSVSATSSTSTPTPSYASGICHIHVDEFDFACVDESSSLAANITMWDNAGTQIGYTAPSNGDSADGGAYPGINANSPLNMDSALPSALQVTGEHDGDYVQFTLLSDPQLSWKSSDTQAENPDAWCDQGNWSPEGGVVCRGGVFGTVTEDAERQMDCYFKC